MALYCVWIGSVAELDWFVLLIFRANSTSFQFVVLLICEMEINASASHSDAMLKSLLGREVFQSTAPFCQLHNLLRSGERKLPWQRGFQIGFKELTIPAIPEHVIHIDISEWLTSLSTFGAQPFPVVVGIGGKGVGAHAANLP